MAHQDTSMSSVYPLVGNEDLTKSWILNIPVGVDLFPRPDLPLAWSVRDMFVSVGVADQKSEKTRSQC